MHQKSTLESKSNLFEFWIPDLNSGFGFRIPDLDSGLLFVRTFIRLRDFANRSKMRKISHEIYLSKYFFLSKTKRSIKSRDF